MRLFLLVFLMLPAEAALAQRRGGSEAKPTQTTMTFDQFQKALWYTKAADSKSDDGPKMFFDTYLARLRVLRNAAKNAKITGLLEPDEWTVKFTDAGKGKDKYSLTVKFRDEERRNAALGDIDKSIEKLLEDKLAVEQGKAMALNVLDLKSDYGILEEATLVSIRGPEEQLWEVNKVLILITGFDFERDGSLVGLSVGKTQGDIYEFGKDGKATGMLRKKPSQKIKFEGQEQSVPAFDFITRDKWPEEERRTGKGFMILSPERYGLKSPP
jgi:hypothetical protein